MTFEERKGMMKWCYCCAFDIIFLMDDIYYGASGNDDFGSILAKAPHENYPEILQHLEKIKELLKSKEE